MAEGSKTTFTHSDTDNLSDLQRIEALIAESSLPPVHLWQPERVANLDMLIKSDGTWWYQGSIIQRQRMVRLFSTILRLEDNGQFCLVTPAEKLIINVEDAPFVAVSINVYEKDSPDTAVIFETNVGDSVMLDTQHRLIITEDESGHPRPYVHVRDGLQALLSRSVYYQLVELCDLKGNQLGLRSRGDFHVIGTLDNESSV